MGSHIGVLADPGGSLAPPGPSWPPVWPSSDSWTPGELGETGDVLCKFEADTQIILGETTDIHFAYYYFVSVFTKQGSCYMSFTRLSPQDYIADWILDTDNFYKDSFYLRHVYIILHEMKFQKDCSRSTCPSG